EENKERAESGKYVIPDVLPLLPAREVMVFPYMIVPLFVGRKQSIAAIEKAMISGRKKFLSLQKDPQKENPSREDLCDFGIAAEILNLLKLPDGTVKILIEGLKRVKVVEFLSEEDSNFMVKVEQINDVIEESVEFQALKRSVVDQFELYVKLNRKIPVEIMMVILNTDDPSRLADIITAHLALTLTARQEIIEETHVSKRFEKLLIMINKEIEILSLEKKIRNNVHDQLEKTQKEYYLREQIKTLQKELGEDESMSREAIEYKEKLAKLKMPDECREKMEKELSKFEKMHPMSAETTTIRNYIEWVIELPWDVETEDNTDINKSEEILEEDHYGLEKVKERILEFLAVRKLAGNKMKGPMLCLVGPPGVGKTSLGRSVARALGRKFVRMSLGGMRDEAEIRGHRRTYVGAMPGRIMQLIHQVKAKNPVMLLDEIDKLSSDFRGDPASALLEALDPEQNSTFNDHYINLPFDLSKVLFMTTANLTHTIPPPLLDRMEIIRIPGYTEDEKLSIATKYLTPKQIEENGLTKKQISFTPDALKHVIRFYTREAGVRNLEREIGSIVRKRARAIAKGEKIKEIKVKAADVEKYLGAKRFKYGDTETQKRVGAVNGLAWSETGGSVMVIECVMMPGKGELSLTGQLGSVMQESAKAAFSYIRSNGEKLGIDAGTFKKFDFHVHVPEGAIPKDGPSAGLALCSSLISLITKKEARGDLAMTGEITLRGRALPIGGVKEKVLAAHSVGIFEVILPDDNRKDLEDIPEKIRKDMKFTFVKNIGEVLKTLFK
ncbi:MAG TPA: endopeptidase La, partial [Candidatus Wallbacteria bacterium]|nr:endopeptidase La [Candidatus Wallbacteria bacterium]